jgi:hypothetical protein
MMPVGDKIIENHASKPKASDNSPNKGDGGLPYNKIVAENLNSLPTSREEAGSKDQ